MYVYIYIFIYTFSFWPQCFLFCNYRLFCGCVSLTRVTVSAGWRLLKFDKFMFWVKILSHIYPNFFICTVPFKFDLTSCIIFCMIFLYRDLLYYIVFYILYYLYLGGFHASDSLSLNGSHPDMLFNLYFFSVICWISIFFLLLLQIRVTKNLVEFDKFTSQHSSLSQILYIFLKTQNYCDDLNQHQCSITDTEYFRSCLLQDILNAHLQFLL